MFQLVIADDEKFVRSKITQILDWESLGFTIAASFGDGQRVIDYIRENHVDVILTDIRMNPVTGIEIAKYAHENRLSAKVILMSGYEDFSYAKSAIHCRVFEYLVKPVSYSDLLSVFTRVKKTLESEQLTVPNHFLVRQLFFDLVTNGYQDLDEMQRQFHAAGVFLNCKNAYYLFYKLTFNEFDKYFKDVYSYGKEGFYIALQNIIPREQDSIYYSIIKIADAKITVIAATDQIKPEEFSARSDVKIAALIAEMEELLHIGASYVRGSVIGNAGDLLDEYIAQNGMDWAVGNRMNGKTDVDIDRRGTIEKALDFINENYCRDIYLDEVAEHVKLSTYHFSRLFKSAMNEKFVDYITKLRMEKAKEMLSESTTKVYEISESVGYFNLQHFYRIFKAWVGCTPAEYRKLKLGEVTEYE